MGNLLDNIMFLPLLLPGFILGAVIHELAHAVVATWLGDATPREEGRLTLNPLAHLDPIGSVMFLVTFLFFSFPFGWARPVMTRPDNFTRPKRDMALVAVAGPASNVLLATVFTAVIVHGGGSFSETILRMLVITIQVNVVLSVFNMLPVPPLDGSRVVGALMPDRMYRDWMNLDQYAPLMFIAMFLIFGEQVGTLVSSGTELIMRSIGQLVS